MCGSQPDRSEECDRRTSSSEGPPSRRSLRRCEGDDVSHMITDRHVPNSLRREQRRFQESFGAAESPTCLLTPDGTVQNVNDAFCRLLSRTRTDTVLRTLLEIIESQGHDLMLAMLDLALAGKVPCLSFRTRCLDGTGVPVPVHVRGVLVSDSDSSPVCFVLELTRT